jgi:hypothetical protein
MKRFHISISVQNIAASVEDYSARLDCQPCVVVLGEYALWRTDTVNFSIRQSVDQVGKLRHLGWEDQTATGFTQAIDVNGIAWERFSAETQADEIRSLWPQQYK